MSKRERIEKAFLYGVFICYVLFLIKLLFLSRVSLSELFNSQRTLDRTINIIPFSSITEYLFSNSPTIKRFAFGNVIGNIAIFIPLGVYLSLFKNNKKIINNLLLIFIVSYRSNHILEFNLLKGHLKYNIKMQYQTLILH